MPGNDEAAYIVSQWLVRADGDLKAAQHLLTLRDDCPTEVVCFHVQQCVEKSLKALLVARGIEFAKTHDIGTLVRLVPEDLQSVLTVEDQERLTDYATTARYPGDDEPIPLAEAKAAVTIACRVRELIRSRLRSDAG